MSYWDSKVALVTGAGTGIGRGIALELGKLGATVVVHYNTSAGGALETVRFIQAAGGRAVAVQANLEHVSECTRLVQETVLAQGGIDILVNNAALSTEAAFFDVSEALWNRIIHVNLRAPFFCTQAAAREMVRRGGGKVVNIGSIHGTASLPVFTSYAASKGGLNMLTRQLAIELAPHRINVNCVAPGVVEVERYLTQYANYDREAVGQTVPWGRVGLPADVAPLVAFLCSEAADFMTGQVIYVDGGQTSLLALPRSSEPDAM
jgi:glucose 1-dehydrogenase/3-oxoacyl-[acyl-carrier protein] reductase